MSPDEKKAAKPLGKLATLRQQVAEFEVLESGLEWAEETLRESGEKYRLLFDGASNPITVYASDGTLLLMNIAAAKELGGAPDDFVGKSVCEVHPGIADTAMERIRQVVESGESREFETVMKLPSGWRWYWSNFQPVRDASGNVKAVQIISYDITERKQMEEALRESEQKYRILFESTLDGVFVIDVETRKIVLVNQAAAKMYGFDPAEDMVLMDPVDFVPLEDRERVIRIITEDMFEKDLRQVNEYRTMTRDGREMWISARGVRTEYQGRPVGLVSFRDVTERRQAEEALRESEQKYRALFENLNDAAFLADVETGRILDTNEQGEVLLGRTREEIIGMHQSELHPPEMANEYRQRFATHVREGHAADYDGEAVSKDGSIIPVNISAAPVTIGEKRLILGLFRNIAERKRVEEELREAEERYRALVNLGGKVGEAIVMLQDTEQGDAIQTFVSNEWPRITGYSRRELLGMSFFDLLHPTHREASLKRHKKKMDGAAMPGLFEMTVIRKDGTEIPIELTSAYTTYQGQRANVAFIRDITERKQVEERQKGLQEELNLSSRLASIGELAAGVAHEINNPLTGILGFSQRLMKKSTDEETSRDLERIHNEARRAAKVVDNLLTFARRREPKKQYLDINEILARTVELRAYELKTGNIELMVELAPSLPEIMVDFQQIQQVFLNIILNAEQAMTEANNGGKLSIKTQQAKGYIRISFADDGPGIEIEHLDKLFGLFFTTRGEKGGTGLGLSVCDGIVTEHGGRIYARSKPGQGATFFVELPLTTAQIDEGKVAEEEPVRRE